MSARFVFGVVCLLTLAVALIWRLPTREPEWEFVFCENDSLFQLHRAQQCLAHYPRVPSVDLYSHHPTGYRVHWLALHSLFYATAARLSGVDAGDLQAMAATVSWIPPLLALLAVLLARGILRAVDAGGVTVAAGGLLCAVAAEVCRPFFFGVIDHHLFAHLGVLLLTLARLRRGLFLWIAGLVSLLAMTPEGPLFVSLFLGCLFLAEALGGHGDSRPDEGVSVAWFLSPFAVATLVWGAERALGTPPLPAARSDWMYFGVFHVAWLAVLGTGLALALALVKRGARRSTAARAWTWAVALAGVALGALAFFGLTGSLDSIVARLQLTGRLPVAEESSGLAAGFWQAAATYRVMAFCGLFYGVQLALAARHSADARAWFFRLVMGLAVALGLKEQRHLYVLSSLQLAGLAFALERTVAYLWSTRLLAASVLRPALPLLLIGTVAYPYWAIDVRQRGETHGGACDRLPVVRQLNAWLAQHTPEAGGPDEARPDYGIFAPWDIGHHIHVLGRRPVVVDPLNYEISGGVEEAIAALWWSRTAQEVTDTLRRYDARYLVIDNPAGQIAALARRHGQSPQDLVAVNDAGRLVYKPALRQFALYRLYLSGGRAPEFGALEFRWGSSEAEELRSGSASVVRIPRLQVYEVRPGAATAPPAG